MLGTACENVTDLSRPTMNYGWLTPESTDEALQRVVLHEFGGAAGLIHEHNPEGGIQWNRDAVIRDLTGPQTDWDLNTIEHNLFEQDAQRKRPIQLLWIPRFSIMGCIP